MLNLVKIRLQCNGISGPLPADIGNLRFLRVLRLNANDLTGPLPASLADIKDLRLFNVTQANFAPTPLQPIRHNLAYP